MTGRASVLTLGMALLLATAYAFPQSIVGQTPTPTVSPEPSPTPTTASLGSISGRIYVDVNADNTFSTADAPMGLEPILNGPVYPRATLLNEGRYAFTDLPPGTYTVAIGFAQPAGCAVPPPFNWLGEPFVLYGCPPSPTFTTPSRTVDLQAGQDLTGVDLPQIPRDATLSGKIWLDGQAPARSTSAAITVNGSPCWNTTIDQRTSLANVTIAYFLAKLVPSSETRCQGGDLDIAVAGRPAGLAVNWNGFWFDQLFGDSGLPGKFEEVSIPPFLGIWGQVVEAATVTPENVFQHEGKLIEDGTLVTALLGSTNCGQISTKTLTGSQGEFGGNLFGLIVPPDSVKKGCGRGGAVLSFCIGNVQARQPAAGPFTHDFPGLPMPVQWNNGQIQDVTLEPTNELCSALALPPTGGSPDEDSQQTSGLPLTEVGSAFLAVGIGTVSVVILRRRLRSN